MKQPGYQQHRTQPQEEKHCNLAVTTSPVVSSICNYKPRRGNDVWKKKRSSQFKKVDDAIDFFHEMVRMKPMLHERDYTLLIGVIVRMKHYTTAISLIKHMYSLGMRADVCTLDIIINCLCHLKQTAFGFSVLGTMFKVGLEPTVVTFTTLVNGLCIEGDVVQAISLVDHMEKIGYESDIHTYGAIINGLCKAGNTSAAIGYLRKMEKRNWKLNVVVYSIMVDGLCKDGLVCEALNLFSEMTSKGNGYEVQKHNWYHDSNGEGA
ncbi:hypothetical protein K1719_030667 [Acacia pycnantha]|nr:hypothetical protein K1719_030667 [Acacia pycnantha]